MKALKVIGIIAVILASIVFFGLAFIGEMSPETSVYLGKQVPKRFMNEIRSLNLLEEGETIKYFYSDAMFDIKDGMYFVTDRHLVVYSSAWDEPETIIDYAEITDVETEYDNSFFYDSYVTVETNSGMEVSFPVSSEKGRDKKFVEYMKAQIRGQASAND
ncbi:MAG: hypothetical protein AAGF10_01555 [Verrucomicrobiota bacterium]